MATEPRVRQPHLRRGQQVGAVERYGRWARWFHAAVYLTVLVLLGTGWWLIFGQEGHPSPLSRLTGWPDTTIHTRVGWTLAVLIGAGLLLGFRAVRTFIAETLRVDRYDGRWLLRWPKAVFTGRFPRHEGHFDPGQRIANIAMVVLLALLVGSGVAMATLHGGPVFVWLVRVHRWSTYAVTPLIAGHILVAVGVLPGYRGVWRSMHLGGRLDRAVARRVWPGWLERQDRADGS
jgi:formate dehydrogenase subunit gamma